MEGIAGYRKEPLTFNPEDLDPYICTHVIYAYATVDPINYQMVPNDEPYDVVQGKEFNFLKTMFKKINFRRLQSCRWTEETKPKLKDSNLSWRKSARWITQIQ